MPALLLVLLLAFLAPAGAAAQELPAFAPVNPVAAGRTPLSFEPFRPYRAGRWGLTAGLSYASTIESNSGPASTYLLDSELLRLRLGVSRDLSPTTFMLADAELLGAYSGFLDGFLDWYHGLLGIHIPERARRPHDEFGYVVDLPGEAPVEGRPDDAFLGDMRLGLGLRVHPAIQSVAVVTLPTSTGPEGYGRGVVTAGLLNTAHLALSSRLIGEGSLGLGLAPRHGSLAESQHELMASGSAGARLRLFGRQSLYANLFYHTPYYHDTGMPALDRYDMALDFGVLIGSGPGHEWRIGMTEDLKPSGPAVDLIFQFGGKF
ncbi:MAG TPA: DUF3187 family protein [Gemmatimonadales bacterium]|nr:DUF3187 family protein [Gemmatimonadales bacterium]